MHTWFITPRLVAFLARFVCACIMRGRHNQMFQNSGNVATLSWPDSSVTILWVGDSDGMPWRRIRALTAQGILTNLYKY